MGTFFIACCFLGVTNVALVLCHCARAVCAMSPLTALNPGPLCQATKYLHNIVEETITTLSPIPESALPSPILRNFASQGGGAQIIPELTSPTYNLPPLSWIAWTRHKIFNGGYDMDNLHIFRPSVVLEDRLSDGACWQFSGNQGQVAVRLAEIVEISHVTVDYVLPTLLSEVAIRRAPKNITVWALVYKEPPVNALTRNAAVLLTSRRMPAKISHTSTFAMLAQFQFDLHLNPVKQIFNVANCGMLTDVVIFKIESNEGGNTTCIYPIGIHGKSSTRLHG